MAALSFGWKLLKYYWKQRGDGGRKGEEESKQKKLPHQTNLPTNISNHMNLMQIKAICKIDNLHINAPKIQFHETT